MPFALSQSKGVNGEYCNYSATIRSWFDKLTTN
jgi:hypothetical protein